MQTKKGIGKMFFVILAIGLFFGAQISFSYAANLDPVGEAKCFASGGNDFTLGRCYGCSNTPGKVNGCSTSPAECQTQADFDLCVFSNDNPIIDASIRGATATPAPVSSASKFEYKLLESFPGFFQKDTVMTDLPGMILAIYKFGIWTVGIAGLFMLVVGGFMYMTSAGNTSTAGNARGIIWDALLGIVAALGAYLILYVINPDLTKINLSFTTVEIREEAEEAQVSGQAPGELYTIDGKQLDAFVATSIIKINQNGIKTVVTSGLRSIETQKQLIIKNCGGFPATRSCSPSTCLLKNGSASCPHTTGRAVDIWALNSSGEQALSQSQCMKNISACFNNIDQKKLINAMKAEGFCVLSSEPWHFEKPKMSSSCT